MGSSFQVAPHPHRETDLRYRDLRRVSAQPKPLLRLDTIVNCCQASTPRNRRVISIQSHGLLSNDSSNHSKRIPPRCLPREVVRLPMRKDQRMPVERVADLHRPHADHRPQRGSRNGCPPLRYSRIKSLEALRYHLPQVLDLRSQLLQPFRLRSPRGSDLANQSGQSQCTTWRLQCRPHDHQLVRHLFHLLLRHQTVYPCLLIDHVMFVKDLSTTLYRSTKRCSRRLALPLQRRRRRSPR